MLGFFRRFQKAFFFFVAAILLVSFVFFGVPTTSFGEVREKIVIGKTIDGASLELQEVKRLSAFLSSDIHDGFSPGRFPNLCNDGVIRKDFIEEGLADRLCLRYFDVLREDLSEKKERVRLFIPYEHPDEPKIAETLCWDHFAPELSPWIEEMKKEGEVSPRSFSLLCKMYLAQKRLNPEILRRVLLYQQQSFPDIVFDDALLSRDMALFGFHSARDWFGENFLDLASEFILNAAAAAKAKGYSVSIEEAKSDLLHRFQEAIRGPFKGWKIGFKDYLSSMGLDWDGAAHLWQKVLLFRNFFQSVSGSSLIDRFTFNDLSRFASQRAVLRVYEWPISLKTQGDLALFEEYRSCVFTDGEALLPSALREIEEIREDLIEHTYEVSLREVDLGKVGMQIGLKDLWHWQQEEKNWKLLAKKFFLDPNLSASKRFEKLSSLPKKTSLDLESFSREQMVKMHPEWIDEALTNAPLEKREIKMIGSSEPKIKEEGKKVRLEEIRQIRKRVLLFEEARPFLGKKGGASSEGLKEEKHPFFPISKEAIAALGKDPMDPAWVQTGSDPLRNQFKLKKKEQIIDKNAKEDWMKEQAFRMFPELWSPIHLADTGNVTFFYLDEKKVAQKAILDQMQSSQQTLALDAKGYLAEQLLKEISSHEAIVIPAKTQQGEE